MTYKSVDKEKIIIIMICACTDINKNSQKYYEIEHACHKSKSGQPVGHIILPIRYFFCLFDNMSKHCKND